MTYEFHLFKPRLGINPLAITTDLVSGDVNLPSSAINQLETIDWDMKKTVAFALLQKNPHLKTSEGPPRHIELHDRNDDTGIGDTGIEIVLHGNGILVYVPYWHTGAKSRVVLEEIWGYLEIIQRLTGCCVFDVQQRQILNLESDLGAVLVAYEDVITQFQSDAEAWITRNNTAQHDEKLARLKWLLGKESDWGIVIFPGGPRAGSLYSEARNCFINGQFLAAIVLGLSCAEHNLAGLCHATGRSNLERAPISTLLKEAKKIGWLDQADFDNLQLAREVRNSIIHFRGPSDGEPIDPYVVHSLRFTISEEDARRVMETVWRLINQYAG